MALLGMKLLNPSLDLMQVHGPMFVIASVLIVSGIQLLALGLLGELQSAPLLQRATSGLIHSRPPRAPRILRRAGPCFRRAKTRIFSRGTGTAILYALAVAPPQGSFLSKS